MNSREAPLLVRKSFWRALLLTLTVAALNVGLWGYLNRPVHIADWHGDIGGLAYNPAQRYQDPTRGIFPNEAELAGDIRLLSRYTKRLRTYQSTETPQVPRLARIYGMTVMGGAWLDQRADNNERELEGLIALSRKYDNIDRAIVGNETVLLGNLSAQQLIGYLDRARAQMKIPVSTAEPLDTWQRHPELIRHVDFVTVHILPYWEFVPRKDAIGWVLGQYRAVRKLVTDQGFPDKPVVIGEVGWPSNGDRRKTAQPSLADEAHFLREWFNVAKKEKLDYFIMEAIDQPWKAANEGLAGAYWGVLDANRQQKFAFTGTVIEDPSWPWKAGIASLVALFPMFWFARHFIRFRALGLAFFLALLQVSVSILVWMATLPYDFYLDPLDWGMLVLLFPAQLAIILILLINGFEFTEVIWRPRWLREFRMLPPDPVEQQPFVSIHLACYNEPPEMVILTLDSLAALDYANYEVIVLDNNTKNPDVWKPVEAHCAALGAKFRFYHLEPWPGFKAGALNYGLEVTDPRAEVVAVVDADYEVRSDWLRALTGYFVDPNVAVVQCPQAHREWEHNAFRRMTNWEYDGFFRIGMHHRNERNAIIQHGTMTMVRRNALEG
ncbi:MAG: glycosyltransferase, partial [Rhodanobacteraceae bacterium]